MLIRQYWMLLTIPVPNNELATAQDAATWLAQTIQEPGGIIIAAWDTPDFATDLANSLDSPTTAEDELESALDAISAPDYLECLKDQEAPDVH